MERCVNLDWLEVYCIEDAIDFPHNADYFRSHGYEVYEREYGTRIYREMFTIHDADGQPWLEIRRNPYQSTTAHGKSVLPMAACHVRLRNRSCYIDGISLQLKFFLEQHHLAFQSISRVDICYDFIRFDSGDYPSDFIARYMRGHYSKVNQCNLRAYGEDRWDERRWNSLAWGARTSCISTKLYCKSKELQERVDKPYIRQAWALNHLVTDMHTLALLHPDGTTTYPDIYRLEFSIKSSVRGWFVMDDERFEKKQRQSIRNTLDCYANKDMLWTLFSSLSEIYFHFKHFRQGVRKYDCPRKVLFTEQPATFIRIERPASVTTDTHAFDRLLKLLQQYQTYSSIRIKEACQILIDDIQSEVIRRYAVSPYNLDELTALRLLVSRHICQSSTTTKPITIQQQTALVSLERGLFGEF